MDESGLRVALKAWDTRWSSLEHCLWACAFVVFVGVTFEIIVVVWEHLLEQSDFRRGVIHSPERPFKPKFFLELAGAALVALGVFGELAVGVMMAKVETGMRDDTAELVALVEQKTEHERLARIKLEQQIADRHITLEQRKKMCEALKPGAGFDITIEHITDSGEDSQEYALEISDVFHDAKWNVLHSGDMFTWQTPLSGFVVETRGFPDRLSAHIVKVHADLAEKALSATGYHVLRIPMSAGIAANVKTDVLVLVGGKPTAKDRTTNSLTSAAHN